MCDCSFKMNLMKKEIESLKKRLNILEKHLDLVNTPPQMPAGLPVGLPSGISGKSEKNGYYVYSNQTPLLGIL